MEQQPIVARCMVEILGAPKEFIAKSLQEHVDKIKKDGLDIQIEKYAEPVPADKLFTQFVELQIAFKDTGELLDFCFDSMPSTVEIMSPEKMELDMAAFEDFVNDLQGRLHQTDMMLKGLQAQKQVLDKNAINILHNFIKFVCKTPQSLEELSKFVGIKSDALSTYVNNLVEKGELKKEGQLFVRNG
ncbi:Uncharacterised protein [uncultured archaeon]|nr:Uncharacterised protein [uncultured archaeon]